MVIPASCIPSVLVPFFERPVTNDNACIPNEGTPKGHFELVQGKEQRFNGRVVPYRNDAACTLLDKV
jgi:hypothetical protein